MPYLPPLPPLYSIYYSFNYFGQKNKLVSVKNKDLTQFIGIDKYGGRVEADNLPPLCLHYLYSASADYILILKNQYNYRL